MPPFKRFDFINFTELSRPDVLVVTMITSYRRHVGGIDEKFGEPQVGGAVCLRPDDRWDSQQFAETRHNHRFQ